MSDNNGRNNGSGPPDLEELWKQINDRLSTLFGQNNQNLNGNHQDSFGSPSNQNGSKKVIQLIFFIVFAIILILGFYKVNEGQRGVVLRLGKYVETTSPGLRWHIPSPIETVEIVNVAQVRTVELGYRGNVKNKTPKEALMLTDDENIVDLQFAVQYTIKSPEDFIFNNRNVEDTVGQAAETAVREIVGKNKMDFVLYEGREQVAISISNLIQQILDRYKSGILISKVTMQNAQPPEQVQASFDDAVKASQDRERQKNEGQAYANDVVPRAKGMAARLIQEAEGYRQRLISTAEGDASRFNQIVTEYNKAPAVTRERLYIEAMQQILSNSTKVLVDQKSGNNLLYLPLDKIMHMTNGANSNNGSTSSSQQSSTTTNQSAETTTPTPAQTQTSNNSSSTLEQVLRNRDGSLKSRNREDR